MSNQQPSLASMYSQVDVTSSSQPRPVSTQSEEQVELLREVLAAQDRTNELLEEMLAQMSATQRQRNHELQQWRKANPDLAEGCREAAEVLSRVHVEYLDRLTDEVSYSQENLVDGEFVSTSSSTATDLAWPI
ncbi:hypothetical protein [Aeoliella mucimassa]|uniref:Uncharacterized protein n=1 Tax=Aeoliella mucimassa TaxID=2527972 RepID=A0A518AV20_9BACT|nr:hypothetical protein [Aeoliella mucimassa]QDU58577.1 hypothetical protein Pan181_48160 [Aeoliella mucimassa]